MAEESPERRIGRLQRILQQAILRDYPNPGRRGCPGNETLRRLATREYGDDHPAWEHVTHCSPCYGEFLSFVEEARREEMRRKARQRRKVLMGAGVAAVAAIVGIVVWQVSPHGGAGSPPVEARYEFAALDLKSRSIQRGDQVQRQGRPLILPRKRLDLTIYLPVGSERGTYQIRVLQKVGEPVVESEGTAVIENGTTVLRTKLDLHDRVPGEYLLGIRQPPWEWTYYQIRIE